MKRQPTVCGSSPWQHVESPLGCRGVAPVWPTWLRWERNDNTACPSPLWSTSDLLLPSEARLSLEKTANQFFRLRRVCLAVGLFLGPTGAGHEQQLRVGPDGLGLGGRFTHADDGGAFEGISQIDGHDFNIRLARATFAGWLAARINKQEPRALSARQHGFHALPVIPAVDGNLSIRGCNAGDVRVRTSAEAGAPRRTKRAPSAKWLARQQSFPAPFCKSLPPLPRQWHSVTG